jgi:hypothetical protein
MDELFGTIIERAIEPALALLPAKLRSPEAVRMLLAIGSQESRFKYRAQIVVGRPYLKGPARGFWQFEQGGGVHGVMTHPETRELARAVCAARKVDFAEPVVHAKLETDDVLAAAFARLLLYSDPRPLPALDAPEAETWAYYFRNWRPGKPHPESWCGFADASALACKR